MKKTYIFIALGLFCFTQAQSIKVSSVISENKITNYTEQKLILVDFWATWCAPCVYATEQLEFLQRANKEKVYILSISDENEAKIKHYLEKRDIQLMVTSDYDNYTFNKYTIKTRPFAVLFDLKGTVLWKGNPSDLSQKELNDFYEKQPKKNKLDKIEDFLVIEKEEVISYKVLTKEKDFFISEMTDSFTEDLSQNEDEITFYGSLSNLFFNLKSTYPFEIKITKELDKNLKMTCSKKMWDNEKDLIIEKVLAFFKLHTEVKEETIEATEVIVKNPKMLWGTNQIDWGENMSNFIISKDRVQADNVSIKKLFAVLNKEKNVKYVYLGSDTNLYDWDLQYEFDDLMQEELESSFGINLKARQLIFPVIHVLKTE